MTAVGRLEQPLPSHWLQRGGTGGGSRSDCRSSSSFHGSPLPHVSCAPRPEGNQLHHPPPRTVRQDLLPGPEALPWPQLCYPSHPESPQAPGWRQSQELWGGHQEHQVHLCRAVWGHHATCTSPATPVERMQRGGKLEQQRKAAHLGLFAQDGHHIHGSPRCVPLMSHESTCPAWRLRLRIWSTDTTH